MQQGLMSKKSGNHIQKEERLKITGSTNQDFSLLCVKSDDRSNLYIITLFALAIPFTLLNAVLTHFLTQNRKFSCGGNGEKRVKDHSTPGNKGLKRAINLPAEPPAAAHNPEVAGSSPASATKKPCNHNGYRVFLFV